VEARAVKAVNLAIDSPLCVWTGANYCAAVEKRATLASPRIPTICGRHGLEFQKVQRMTPTCHACISKLYEHWLATK
jgi:hypothetical protein